jgi:hypothetical protein
MCIIALRAAIALGAPVEEGGLVAGGRRAAGEQGQEQQ